MAPVVSRVMAVAPPSPKRMILSVFARGSPTARAMSGSLSMSICSMAAWPYSFMASAFLSMAAASASPFMRMASASFSASRYCASASFWA